MRRPITRRRTIRGAAPVCTCSMLRIENSSRVINARELREAQLIDVSHVATRIPNQPSKKGAKQQAKSEARPNEPSKPRAWFLVRE
jgi:hypothetical protein